MPNPSFRDSSGLGIRVVTSSTALLSDIHRVVAVLQARRIAVELADEGPGDERVAFVDAMTMDLYGHLIDQHLWTSPRSLGHHGAPKAIEAGTEEPPGEETAL